jgi:hypothetical protein
MLKKALGIAALIVLGLTATIVTASADGPGPPCYPCDQSNSGK